MVNDNTNLRNAAKTKNDDFYTQYADIEKEMSYYKDYFKDISKLGRDLKRTIIIDTMPQNILLHKENGIIVKPFLYHIHLEQAYSKITKWVLVYD